MKKVKSMRVASALLVAVLLTTCTISGTFAKYVTTGTGSDTARVAKWGVEIETTTEGLFADTYVNEEAIADTAIGAGVSVDSADDADVIAPGTTGSIDFSISGTPEVAVAVDFVMTVNSDVIIPAGTTVAADTTLTAAYTPVVFTLKAGEDELAKGTLAEIEDVVEGLSSEYAPNATLDKEYTLSWEWAFDGNDAADTYLGDVAAEKITDDNVKTTIDFDYTITVTQID